MMKFCVIGLGRFGFQVATGLAERNLEVLAIDSSESIVASIRDHVTHAICMRVTDENSLRAVGVDQMDTIIVATGENFAQSILITALLKKKTKAPYVIARAINDIHHDILKLVGADETILPEKEIGIRLASSLASPFTDVVPVKKEFTISHLPAPEKFVGKKVEDLKLFGAYKIHCIGIQRSEEKISSIDPEYIIAPLDELVFSGHPEDLEKITKL
jgi:trk system potassium uptake protein TrkA